MPADSPADVSALRAQPPAGVALRPAAAPRARAWAPWRMGAVSAWLRGTQRTHRVLIIATLVLPLFVLGTGSYLAWQAAVTDARARLARNVDVARENAEHVFETYDLLLKEAGDALAGLTDAEIASREPLLHARLVAMIERLPQVQDVFAVDAEGHPIVSAYLYPVVHGATLPDRDYFQSARDAGSDLLVGSLHISRLNHTSSFDVTTRKASGSGAFQGTLAVLVNAGYFETFWKNNGLADATADGMTMVLFRSDGTFLARWPQPIVAGVDAKASAAFRAQIARAPESGSYELRYPDDGVYRLVAYRHVEDMPLYVVASLRRSGIVATWLSTMEKHLYFGVPATLALFALAIGASRRARRESRALELLEAEVRRREQMEEAFRQSQKMEAIGRLTGGIAHDFNNLLTAISGSIEYLTRAVTKDDERTTRYSAMAREAVQRATTLTHRLLAFARQQPLEKKPVNLNRMVSGMSDLLLRTLGEDIRIETVLAGGLWPTDNDPNQLENTLLNLAINARDAMPEGGRLTIETANTHLDAHYAAAHAEVSPGQYVMLAVTDTGRGMPPEVVGRAFEPFFTTKPVGKGTGLGLSMVYGFMKQSGGHIKIYSEVGLGTTVKIYLPRSRVSAEVAVDQPAVAPAARSARGETIMVVEDDDAVREFSVTSLEELGYRVIAARDAASALELLGRSGHVDLLFTDVVLPGGMDGRRLSERVRALRPGMPVLFTTGYTPNAIIHNGVLDPGVQLLPKPFSTVTLADKLGAMLAPQKQLDSM